MNCFKNCCKDNKTVISEKKNQINIGNENNIDKESATNNDEISELKKKAQEFIHNGFSEVHKTVQELVNNFNELTKEKNEVEKRKNQLEEENAQLHRQNKILRKKIFKDHELSDYQTINNGKYEKTIDELREDIFFLDKDGRKMNDSAIQKAKNGGTKFTSIKMFIKTDINTYDEYTYEKYNNKDINNEIIILAHQEAVEKK